jgi:nicotinate-nucleotide adenylyltransferase
MKSIGLYFGSFNPVHFGHLQIAQLAKDQMMLDEVWLMVSPQNPFKENTSLAREEHRLQMTQLACAQLENVNVLDLEFHLAKPSYTIHTLRELITRYPKMRFHIILGEDNLESFHKWKEPEAILDLCEIIVYPRFHAKPAIPRELEKYSARIHFLSGELLAISATAIREKIKQGENIDGLIPATVIDYITAHNLYA